MITEKERNELKSILPTEYAKAISQRLNASGFSPRRAKIYNPKIIRQVFNGEQSDINVELDLFRYRDEILAQKHELQELRNKTVTTPDDPAITQ